jgi:hypothetical protein
MANDSEKKSKARVEQARNFCLQFLPAIFLFFFLFRLYRRVLDAGATVSTLAAAAGAMGALVCLPEALRQRHFLGLPTSLRLLDRIQQLSVGAAWGVRAGAWAALVLPLAAARFYAPRHGPSSLVDGYLDAFCVLLNVLFTVPVAYLYTGAFDGAEKGSPHLENMLALCIMTQVMAAFTARGWFALFFIPPYAAYLLYDTFSGLARVAMRGGAGAGAGGGGAALPEAPEAPSSKSSAKKPHAPGTHRR